MDYWSNMDRDYFRGEFAELVAPTGSEEGEKMYVTGTTQLVPGAAPKAVMDSIYAKVKEGHGHIELVAPGTGAGGQGRSPPSFEEFDRDTREAIRDVQKAIDISVSTHATPSVWGMSGLDKQNGRFSESQRQTQIREIQKAIDFASDATFGGSVVLHTGEFTRPLYNSYRDEKGEALFEEYRDEDKDATYLVYDENSRQIAGGIREDMDIWLPEKKKDEKGNVIYIKTEDGKDYVDPISKEKVPEYEKRSDSNDINFQKYSFHEFVDEQLQEEEKKRQIIDYIKQFGGNPKDLSYKNPLVKEFAAKLFQEERQQANISQQLMSARQYLEYYTEGLRDRDKILQNLDRYKKLKEQLSPEEYRDLYIDKPFRTGGVPEQVDPIDFFRQQLNDNDRQLAMGREANLSAQRQVNEAKEHLKDLKTVREFTLEKSADSYSELGLYAYDKTKAMEQSLKGSKYKERIKPITLTMENLFPEGGYGAHADEIIDIVDRSRAALAEKLHDKRGLSEQEAKEAAAKHVKVTFDTGHFNMWRKYFKRRDNESDDQFHERYQKWYLKEFEKLAKAGVIGNMHIADNFGYDDVHLAPGDGNAPVTEVVGILQKYGYDDSMSVEGGWNHGKVGIHELWKARNVSIHRRGTEQWTNLGSSSAWGNVQDAYLGSMHRPYFHFGDNLPARDSQDWAPWSGTRME